MSGQLVVFVAAVVATFFVAGAVKGVTGMGLPTVAMGALGLFMPPAAAAALLIVPSFVTNVWQLVTGPSLLLLLRRLWPMLAGILIGTVAGAAVLTGGNTRWTTVALGVALVTYAAVTLIGRPWSVPARAEPWLSPLIGVLTGLVTGATGVFVIPAVPYLQALSLEKDDLIQALGSSFTVSTIALAIGLFWHGALPLDRLASSSLAVAPALAGMWLGQSLRSRISPPVFRRWFLICLIALGIELVARAWI